MRKELEIEPANFYYDYSQIKDKIKDGFLYLENGVIVGAVSCYGNELDDLIVKKSFQGQGNQYLDNGSLRFSFVECFMLQGVSKAEMVQMVFYTFICPNGFLLRNI